MIVVDLILAISRMGIILTGLIILVIFCIGIHRVWESTKSLNEVWSYTWSHFDKLMIGVFVTGAYIWLVYFQAYKPASSLVSTLINLAWFAVCLWIMRGSLLGYRTDVWTVRGTRRKEDSKVEA